MFGSEFAYNYSRNPDYRAAVEGGMTVYGPLWTVFVGLTLFRYPGNQVQTLGSYDGIITWQL
jgi:hypothetical protein